MKEFIKKNKINFVIIICVICAGLTTVSAAVILFSSNEVSYDNATSGMSSNNVQDAIDELYGVARLSDRIDELEEELHDYWETVYPVGSIYISINSANPSTKFGGTWTAYGSGRTLVGVNTSDTSFNTVEKTGGEKTHNHSYAHTHGVPGVAHTHNLSKNGGANMRKYSNVFYQGMESSAGAMPADGASRWWLTEANGDHSSTTMPIQQLSGIGLYGKTDSTTPGGTTTNSQSTSTTGSGNSLQPYITVYMWKRTA